MSLPSAVLARPSSSSRGFDPSTIDPEVLGAHILLKKRRYLVRAAVLALDAIIFLTMKSLQACRLTKSAKPCHSSDRRLMVVAAMLSLLIASSLPHEP